MVKLIKINAVGNRIIAFSQPEQGQDEALYTRPNDEHDFAQHIALLMADLEQSKIMGQLGTDRIVAEYSWLHQKKILFEA
jgi:hypothetical protein